MRKTSLYLDPDVDLALARRARTEGITKAELIRRVLAEAVDGDAPPPPVGAGIWDGPGDISERVDEYLDKWGFGRD